MVNPYVPEADFLEQQQEVIPSPEPDDEENEQTQGVLEYPERLPIEAAEADVLEQNQSVEFDDDWEQ